MGLPNEIHPFLITGNDANQYKVANSLRFRSSAPAYLSRTPASAGNRKTWTWSGWVKKTDVASRSGLFSAGSSSGSPTYTETVLQFESDNTLLFFSEAYTSAWVYECNFITSIKYRDPSAWMHVIVAVDTTQATDTNRVKIYVNGVQIPASGFATASYPALNADLWVNTTRQHVIGTNWNSGVLPSAEMMDGYMAEVNFIDGYPTVGGTTYNATTWAALNVATLFGAFDTNGVWQPKAYTGTYSGNSFYLPFNVSVTTSYAGSFNGSTQYLTTPANANLALGAGDFTIECWFNQTTQNNNGIVCQDYLTGVDIRINEGSGSNIGFYAGSGTFVSGTYSGAGQWHHMAVVRNGSGTNNMKLYVDGLLICQATNTNSFTANQFRVGSHITGSTTGGALFNGSISNVRVVKGTAIYTAPFTPSSSPFTAVTNTQLLCMQNSSATQDNSANAFTLTNTATVTTSAATPWSNFIVGQDSSGLGNGWASANVNVTSSGTTYDSMIDSPTNYADGGNGRGNYAVLNPFLKYSGLGAPTEGNLNTTANNLNWRSILSSIAVTSGKWYAEVTIVSASTDMVVGVFNLNDTTTLNTLTTVDNRQFARDLSGYGWQNNGNKINNNTGVSYNGGATYTTNNVIGIALDLDSGTTTLTFYKDGVSQGQAFTGLSGNFVFASSAGGSGTYNWNFGQRPFVYTPPSGFKAINTYNLPAPSLPLV